MDPQSEPNSENEPFTFWIHPEWRRSRVGEEAAPLNGVIMVCKRWSCSGWQPISHCWHQTAANESYSGWFVSPCSTTHAHRNKRINGSKQRTPGGKRLRTQRSERSRNLWRKTGSQRKTVKYIRAVWSTQPPPPCEKADFNVLNSCRNS